MQNQETVLEPDELLAELVNKGGSIVCSNSCTEKEINEARLTRRFAVSEDGIGFVLRRADETYSFDALKSAASGKFLSKDAPNEDTNYKTHITRRKRGKSKKEKII